MGLAAKFTVQMSLSTLGPVGGRGSELFGGISHSVVGPVGRFGSEVFGGIVAK